MPELDKWNGINAGSNYMIWYWVKKLTVASLVYYMESNRKLQRKIKIQATYHKPQGVQNLPKFLKLW